MPSRTYKFRGQRTHGRGKKAGRGAGKRGGKGNAGMHKHKYMATLKYAPLHFGRHGFKTHVGGERDVTINIRDLNYAVAKFTKDGHAKESGGAVAIDLGAAGYTKLLATGTPAGKFKITVERASAGAVEKIKSAGGDVALETDGGDAPKAGK